jgi:hypothetical protein
LTFSIKTPDATFVPVYYCRFPPRIKTASLLEGRRYLRSATKFPQQFFQSSDIVNNITRAKTIAWRGRIDFPPPRPAMFLRTGTRPAKKFPHKV